MIFASILMTFGASFFLFLAFIHIGPVAGAVTLHIVAIMLFFGSGMVAGEAIREELKL